ncbi:MAG: hypothetical protein ACYC6Y_01625 [Thermoguttaceae bacterium]
MREILDEGDSEDLRGAFGDVFRQLQRGKALEPFAFYNGAYLLSLDGTSDTTTSTISGTHRRICRWCSPC